MTSQHRPSIDVTPDLGTAGGNIRCARLISCSPRKPGDVTEMSPDGHR